MHNTNTEIVSDQADGKIPAFGLIGEFPDSDVNWVCDELLLLFHGPVKSHPLYEVLSLLDFHLAHCFLS